ncbi:MAG: hypothetical protein JWN95_1792 [Frankiales bacterium]|nr:hypothetical protein [Frankiales bacterium]
MLAVKGGVVNRRLVGVLIALILVVVGYPTRMFSVPHATPSAQSATSYAYDEAVNTAPRTVRDPEDAVFDAGTATWNLGRASSRPSPFAAFFVAAETGAGAIPSTSSLADDLANATGAVAKANKGGYTLNVPNGSRGIAVRIMDEGGGRTNY